MDHQCQKCGDYYTIRPECEPTTFCDSCAQDIVAKLEAIVPAPPQTITSKKLVELLEFLQQELHKPPYAESGFD